TAGVSGTLHHRDRMDSEGWVSARDAGGGLRRLVHGDEVDRRASMPWAERRHPGVEPGDAAAARAVVDGDPGECGDAAEAARDHAAARFPALPLPPGD